MPYLSECTEPRLAAAAASAGTSDVTGGVCDMAGFDGVLIFCTIATNAADNYLQAEQGDASDLSDAAALAGSKCATASTADVAMIDLFQPAERYVRGVLKRGTSTASGDMYYLRYNATNKPSAAAVANAVKLVQIKRPAEGTP